MRRYLAVSGGIWRLLAVCVTGHSLDDGSVIGKRLTLARWSPKEIVELCAKAGHLEPEFLERAGAVGVRFLPSGYVAPHSAPSAA